MRFIISICLALLFSTNGNTSGVPLPSFENLATSPLIFKPTIDARKDTRTLFTEFQDDYTKGNVLTPRGLDISSNELMKTMIDRESSGVLYLDQLVYQGSERVAYVHLGDLFVMAQVKHHYNIFNAWRGLGFITEDCWQKDGIGIGYIAFGFASNVGDKGKTDIIKEGLAFVKNLADSKALLYRQDRVPTHFVSLVAVADKSLLSALRDAGFVLHNTEDGKGFSGFDIPVDPCKRNRLIAVYTL